MPDSMIIVSMSDALSPSAGGITPDVIAYIGNVERVAPALVGLEIDGRGPLCRWRTEELNSRPFRFFPLLRLGWGHESKKRFPISPLFLSRLLWHRRSILRIEGSLHVCRPEFALPFLLGRRTHPIVVGISGSSRFIGLASGHPYYKWPFVRWVYLLMERYVLSRADAVVTISHDACDDYRQRMPFLGDRLQVIPPAIDTDLFSPRDKLAMRDKYGLPRGGRLIVYAGRFSPEKRVDRLMAAFERLHKMAADTVLILAGDGPERGKLDASAPSDGSVRFMGVLGRKQMAEVMSACDVAVLFSVFEGMSIFVLESLASGLPVVSTDVGDVPRVIVDGSTGFIVRSSEIDEFAMVMGKALDRAGTWQQRCREVALKFSAKAITKQVEDLHIRLMRSHG